MSFLFAGFLSALAAVAGPLVIHLLSRRRYRVLEWAAMDFLRDAVKRNKRILNLRDILLLILRTLAVLFFILALARPYWGESAAAAGPSNQPAHAVVVIDNSLSMAYTELDASLLDLSRRRAIAFVRSLPDQSMVSLVVMCPESDDPGRFASLSALDAAEAIDRIRVVDRTANLPDSAEQVRKMLNLPVGPAPKYIVFFSDMQHRTWATDLAEALKTDSPIHVVQAGQAGRDNTAVVDLQLRDGMADAQTPAVFIATVRHYGSSPRPRVRVALKVDDQVVAERSISLQPGQTQDVIFKHRFAAAGTLGDPLYVPVSVELEHDHLAIDDSRSIVVPVVSRVPVVFVDELGDRESLDRNQLGQTLPLRRLLSPVAARRDGHNAFIDIRHVSPDQITRDVLKDARLVVIAGVRGLSSPTDDLLRQYVEQGGQLIIAAGGEFDSSSWNAASWRDGAGILPMPLRAEMIGRLPTAEALDVPVFHLDPTSFRDPLLEMPTPRAMYEQLLASPFFFQAAGVDDQVQPDAQAERERLVRTQLWLGDSVERERRWAELARQGTLTDEDRQQQTLLAQVRAERGSRWLTWSHPLQSDPWALPLERLEVLSRPRVVGRYSDGNAFAVRRDLGDGTILLITTGILPRWNNMAVDQSVLLFDHVMRSMLSRSVLPQSLEAAPVITVPLKMNELAASYSLIRPGDQQVVPLVPEALGERAYGLRIRHPLQRGIYTVRRAADGETSSEPDAWGSAGLRLAVNGPVDESDLQTIDAEQLATQLQPLDVRWINPGEAIAAARVKGVRHELWVYCMSIALLCVLAEVAFLAFGAPPSAGRGAAA